MYIEERYIYKKGTMS